MRSPATSTIQDLADHLGLDKSTVSLALRGSRRISENTQRRVVQAARERGYRPNLAARLLASSSPQTVGLVLPARFEALRHEVVVMSVQKLAQLASAAGVLFVLVSSDDLVGDGRSQPPAFRPDGLLVWGDLPAHLALSLGTERQPVVVLDPSDASYASYAGPMVGLDNAGGGRKIAEHLVEQGASRLLFIQGSRDSLGHQQRWHGAREGWVANRSLDTLAFCYLDELDDRLLGDYARGVDAAIFCSNDHCASEVWHRLLRLGIRVPDQVLLAGFDGDRVGELIGLTTVVFDSAELARRGFDLLVGLWRGDSADAHTAAVPLRMRPGRTTQKTSPNPKSEPA
jgi:LacI family transcriptional regulator